MKAIELAKIAEKVNHHHLLQSAGGLSNFHTMTKRDINLAKEIENPCRYDKRRGVNI
ncbi:MAG: hypothetical protein WAM14_01880 [Candidatus Nitrosopolaris sp.]